MATRSSIAILNLDGTVHGHYCHNDGYLSYNGEILYEHYRDVAKVKELIALGDMSSLAQEVSPPNGVEHSFNARHDGVCVFYGRDRGEEGTETKKYNSLEEYFKEGNFEQYDYIFDEQKEEWFLLNHDDKKLVKLTDALIEDEGVSAVVKKTIKSEKQAKSLSKELPINGKTEELLKI